MMTSSGKVIIFTGNGKGKTTAGMGLVCCALEMGLTVLVVQFMKAEKTSGEHFTAEQYGDRLKIKALGRKGFMTTRTGKPVDHLMAQYALEEVKAEIETGRYDWVLIDEANVAVYMNLIKPEDIIDVIDRRPGHVGLIITGRYAHPLVVERADIVSEFSQVKHYYDQGVASRKGIEY
jgi:cob(I)alamin adenosyltransferase